MLLVLWVWALFSSAAMPVAALPNRGRQLDPASDERKEYLERGVDLCVNAAYQDMASITSPAPFERALLALLQVLQECQRKYNTVPKIDASLRHVFQRAVNRAYAHCRESQEKTKGECIEEASVTTRGQTKGGLDEEWKPQTGLLFEDDKDNGLLSYARHRVNENAGRFGPNLRPTFNGLRERIGAHFQRYFKLDPASPARGGGMPFGGRAIPLGI